jgi:hypothetical protein
LSSQSGSADVAAGTVASRSTAIARERIAWAAAVVAALLAGYGIFSVTRPRPEPPAVIRFEIVPPKGTTFGGGSAAPNQTVSPDGRRVAFAVLKDDVNYIAVRTLDALDAQVLPGTEFATGPGAALPFWSPTAAPSASSRNAD